MGEDIELLRKKAELGDAEAQCNLGRSYYYGEGVSKDYEEAVRWYRKAAEQGDAEAQSSLGHSYYYGEGVSKDYKEAVRWLRKAAEQGDSLAQDLLGWAYDKGNGVKINLSEAFHWFRKAAEQGDSIGQCIVGFKYNKGQGVPKDYAEALRWYRMAADQGETNAEYRIGNLYKDGNGVKQDIAEAVQWYRKAAAHGNKDAQQSLEKCLSEYPQGQTDSIVRSCMSNYTKERVLLAGCTLRKLIDQFGAEVIQEPKKLSGLISDFIQERGVANTLKSAVEEGIPQALGTLAPGIPWEASAGGLISRLQADRGLGEDAARFAVLVWALALQIVDEAGLNSFFRTR